MGTGPVPMESVGAIWEAHWLQEPPRAEGAHPGYVGKKAQQNKSNTFSKRNHIKLIFNTHNSSIAKKKKGYLGNQKSVSATTCNQNPLHYPIQEGKQDGRGQLKTRFSNVVFPTAVPCCFTRVLVYSRNKFIQNALGPCSNTSGICTS